MQDDVRAADVHQRSLELGPWAEAYVPMAQSHVTGAEMAVRTQGDPIARLPAIRAAAFRAASVNTSSWADMSHARSGRKDIHDAL